MKLVKDLGMQYPTETSKKKLRYGIYICPECNKEFSVITASVKSGHTKSCGCVRISKITKHNCSKERLHTIWNSIIQRCNNEKSHAFRDYGGRNISICKKWKENFLAFKKWALENGYKENLEIDRIDNNGNYEPSNCRWTTRNIQCRNTRLSRANTSGYRGVTYNKISKKFKVKIVVNSKAIHLGYYTCRLAGAYAYDKYVADNNLEHTRNFI